MEKIAGFDLVRRPVNGANYSFRQGNREVNFYLNDNDWYVFVQDVERKKTEDGYFLFESLGITAKEFEELYKFVLDSEVEKECNA